jgi:3-deoxy-D-manno-octulosonic-acid transferase
MGMMLLAPHDIARCEPVYREAIKYRLQTIRHNRFSTSFIPLQTRVYYIEEPEPLTAMYACADFVIAGGTLHEDARNAPDLITPILHGKPVVVGAAQRHNALLASAIESNVVRHADNEEQLFSQLRGLIDDPQNGILLARRASEWLSRQPGSKARVLALID